MGHPAVGSFVGKPQAGYDCGIPPFKNRKVGHPAVSVEALELKDIKVELSYTHRSHAMEAESGGG